MSDESPRVNVLGVGISAVNMGRALEIIRGWIERREQHYVCVTPAHVVMECYHHPDLYPLLNLSGLTTPDGVSIVWLLRLQGRGEVGRVCGPDLMEAVCDISASKGWRHYFYGGRPGVAALLEKKLTVRHPGLQVVGLHSPPFSALGAEEDARVVEQINASSPDIVWIGISSPKQEQWMAAHVGKVSAPVLVGVGAAFDFLSGVKPRAPIWMQRSGLEWLYRLGSEPDRLWRRYVQYPLFGILVAAQLLGLRRFED
jgi:N-acetylglucosaminyldiphosphoundecaprenol N-acetyl-beta-D-mannosaminyltransferase